MTLPFALPDWLPWWVPIVLLVPALLWLLAFLFMPFNVFGTKGRLEAVEARLDEIQGEIRSLALRMPEPVRHAAYEEVYTPQPAPPPTRYTAPSARPPIPPAPQEWQDLPRREPPLAARSRRPEPQRPGSRGRSEPKLDWPDPPS